MSLKSLTKLEALKVVFQAFVLTIGNSFPFNHKQKNIIVDRFLLEPSVIALGFDFVTEFH